MNCNFNCGNLESASTGLSAFERVYRINYTNTEIFMVNKRFVHEYYQKEETSKICFDSKYRRATHPQEKTDKHERSKIEEAHKTNVCRESSLKHYFYFSVLVVISSLLPKFRIMFFRRIFKDFFRKLNRDEQHVK